ncbi:MAG TPA: class I SAM-dependent methyltransferase [Actinomycetota bacterium]|nr:class I SAM-dependent methyltransferase [Actinomycetota bacterium]
MTQPDLERQNAKRRKAWNKQSASYDKQIGWFERNVFGTDNRSWACGQATGDTLEVAVGTGLNFPHYGPDVRLTAIDLSPSMLEIARTRAASLANKPDLREGDAHKLPFADGSFDSLVCTFSLCNIPDPDAAVGEMKRVLRPDGRLLLVDHIRSENMFVYALQKVFEFISVRMDGDHMTRRPREQVERHGFVIESSERFKWGGIVERIRARNPA